ncbi:hypothetical protein EI94DRAFT_1627060, partial [Lactarius quietus]
DVRWGYNNIRIKAGDEHKAVFKTPYGLFEPTVVRARKCVREKCAAESSGVKQCYQRVVSSRGKGGEGRRVANKRCKEG